MDQEITTDNLRMIGNGLLVNTNRLLFATFATNDDCQNRCVTLRFDNDHELKINLPADMPLDHLFKNEASLSRE